MNPTMQIVIDFMNVNLHRKLSLDELAKSAQISRSNVWRLFKTEAGMPPGQYLQKLRMRKASTLLTTTLMSVKRILIEVGYSDKILFARHFKKAYGMTPSEYRAKYHNLILAKGSVAPPNRNVG